MRHMADRIQTRAIRRCGELLQQVEAKHIGRPPKINREGAHPIYSRTHAASDAGLSEHQRKTALRVANVPEVEFEEAVESDDPPTVSKLADRGRKPQPKAAHEPAPTPRQCLLAPDSLTFLSSPINECCVPQCNNDLFGMSDVAT